MYSATAAVIMAAVSALLAGGEPGPLVDRAPVAAKLACRAILPATGAIAGVSTAAGQAAKDKSSSSVEEAEGGRQDGGESATEAPAEPAQTGPEELDGGKSAGPASSSGDAASAEDGGAEASGQGGAGQGQQQLTDEQIAIKADRIFVTDKALAAEGHVEVRTKDLTITAEVVEVDREAEVAHFRGNVVITGNNQQTHGEELWVDLDSGWWKISGARTKVEPELFAGNVLEPLFGQGGEAEEDPTSGVITLRRAMLTSCELAEPHYCLRSSRVRVKPGDKVTLRRPALYLWGHRIFRYPFNVTLSLRESRQKIVPEIGRNEVEGRYAKFAFLYLMGAHNNGVARLHFTEKRGTGFGFDHLLEDHRQSLLLSVFDEPSQGALSVRATHNYVFGKTLRSDASVNYQRNSGYMYSSTTLSSDVTFRNVDADSDTTFGFQRSQTTSAYGSTTRWGMTFYQNQRLGRRTSWSLRDTYTSSRFANQTASDEEMNVDFEFRHQAHSYDVQVEATNRYDIDGSRYEGDKNYYSLNRLPLIQLSTDTRRLGGWRLLGRASTRMRLELGRFTQDPDGRSVYRAAFFTDVGGREQQIDAHTTARTSVRFRQSWFDDGSAQYHAGLSGELRHSIDGHWHTRLAYRRASTRGFAPLRIDYGGRSNELTWGIVRYSPDSSRFELTGGYDFITDRYRDLRLTAEWRTSAHSYYRLQTAYSIEDSRWWPVVLRFVGAGSDAYVELNANYDVERSKLSSVTMDSDLRLGRWWRVELLGSYSGWTRRIDQAQVRVTRDLHCLVAQLTWSKWPRELTFNIGIKAFPSYARPMGIGRPGAYMPGTPGAYY